jgi:hypothetical protein
MIMVADMGDMTAKNWDFSSEGSKFNQAQLVLYSARENCSSILSQSHGASGS